jgi:poly(hydroxyalkanoate) depolymerase family esterase
VSAAGIEASPGARSARSRVASWLRPSTLAVAVALCAAVLALVPRLLLGVAAAGDERFVAGMYQRRSYRLFVPANPAASTPLVVALHGCAQTPDDFVLGTRLNHAAARRGLTVLYPAQGRLDNPSRCWNWFAFENQIPTGGEIASILGVVQDVQRTHGVDAARLVVLGLSAGGYMAVNLACAVPDLVIGVGVMAGGPYRCAENAARAGGCMRGDRLDGVAAASRCMAVTGRPVTVRASLWHGDGDSVVSPANLGALTTMFVTLHERAGGATKLDQAIERVDGAVRTVYRGAGERPVVESWLVSGMGHAWSGGDPRGTHTFPAGPDATEHMLAFLVDSASAR